MGVYDGVAWSMGPARVYERLARAVVARCPLSLVGARVLDAGAGTGIVGAVASAQGAHVVAADLSLHMVRQAPPPRVVADLGALPFRARFDVALGGCVINHFAAPQPIVASVASVLRPGGAVVLSSFPRRPDAVKEAIDSVARAHGWQPPDWFRSIKATQEGPLGDLEGFAAIGRAGGLEDVRVFDLDVAMTGLTSEDAVGYRFGLGQFTGWFAEQDDAVHLEALAAVEPLIAGWAMPLLVLVGRAGRSTVGPIG